MIQTMLSYSEFLASGATIIITIIIIVIVIIRRKKHFNTHIKSLYTDNGAKI